MTKLIANILFVVSAPFTIYAIASAQPLEVAWFWLLTIISYIIIKN